MKQLMLAFSALLVLGAAAQSNAAIKWHPGHYVWLDQHIEQSAHFKNIDEIASVSSIKGVEVQIYWAELERAKGQYDFSKIDAYLAKLKSLPVAKRLVVRVMERKFGSSTSGIVPDYLRNEAVYNGGTAPMDFEMPQDPEFLMGGGGLYSTPNDYLRFLRMLLKHATRPSRLTLCP